MIFMNFRADRAIEFSEAMIKHDFPHFDRDPFPRVCFASMTQYDLDNCFPEDFPKCSFWKGVKKYHNCIGEHQSDEGLYIGVFKNGEPNGNGQLQLKNTRVESLDSGKSVKTGNQLAKKQKK